MSDHSEQTTNDNPFLAEMGDVTKLADSDTIYSRRREVSLAKKLKREALEQEHTSDPNPLAIEAVDPVDPHDFLSYKKDGVQDLVFKNLRLGKYSLETRLTIHHLKFKDARQQVFQCIKDCHHKGIRALVIEHGMGLHSKPFPGHLKSYTCQWLQQLDEVIAFHTALKQHGGLGAVYVLLKKNAQQKQLNRDRHQRGLA